MRLGKVSDSRLTRSVMKQITFKNEEIKKGAGIGEDCAFFSCKDADLLSCVAEAAVAEVADMGRLFTSCANNLYTCNATPVAALMTVILPPETEEPFLKEMMKEANRVAREKGLAISGGHTTVSPYVTKPMVSVTALGKREASKKKPEKIKPGMDLVVTKWIALEGTSILAKKYEEKLKKRYPSHLVETAINFDTYLSVEQEAKIAWDKGAVKMHDVSEGGIFAALWEMAEGAAIGVSLDLRKLPIRQETVEVCEELEKNPYELLGTGSLLIATPDGDSLVEALMEAEIPAVVVGKFTEGKEKLIFNEDEKRYMDRPAIDQIYEV